MSHNPKIQEHAGPGTRTRIWRHKASSLPAVRLTRQWLTHEMLGDVLFTSDMHDKDLVCVDRSNTTRGVLIVRDYWKHPTRVGIQASASNNNSFSLHKALTFPWTKITLTIIDKRRSLISPPGIDKICCTSWQKSRTQETWKICVVVQNLSPNLRLEDRYTIE